METSLSIVFSLNVIAGRLHMKRKMSCLLVFTMVILAAGSISGVFAVLAKTDVVSAVVDSADSNLLSKVKNALKGIKSGARIKVSSSLKAYKKLLKRKGQSNKVKITK